MQRDLRFTEALFAAATAASILLLTACQPEQRRSAPPQLSKAGVLFNRHCAVCHGKGGEGGQVGVQQVPNLKGENALALSDEQLTRQIFDGGKAMPPFKYTLTDDEIGELVRFIRRELQAPDAGRAEHEATRNRTPPLK